MAPDNEPYDLISRYGWNPFQCHMPYGIWVPYPGLILRWLAFSPPSSPSTPRLPKISFPSVPSVYHSMADV